MALLLGWLVRKFREARTSKQAMSWDLEQDVPSVFLATVIVLVLAFMALVLLAVGLGVALVEGLVAGVVGPADGSCQFGRRG